MPHGRPLISVVFNKGADEHKAVGGIVFLLDRATDGGAIEVVSISHIDLEHRESSRHAGCRTQVPVSPGRKMSNLISYGFPNQGSYCSSAAQLA